MTRSVYSSSLTPLSRWPTFLTPGSLSSYRSLDPMCCPMPHALAQPVCSACHSSLTPSPVPLPARAGSCRSPCHIWFKYKWSPGSPTLQTMKRFSCQTTPSLTLHWIPAPNSFSLCYRYVQSECRYPTSMPTFTASVTSPGADCKGNKAGVIHPHSEDPNTNPPFSLWNVESTRHKSGSHQIGVGIF